MLTDPIVEALTRRNDAALLLAEVTDELDQISATAHRLARRRALLQEQATRLRLGAPVSEVRVVLARLSDDDD